MARKRFNFWLEDKRPDDWQVNELITTLKRAGQFTRAIREGLRLWVDLRAGNTAVLCELFPFIADKLTPPTTTPTAGGAGGQNSDLAREIAAQIILQGGTSGYLMQSAQPAATTGRQLSAPKFDLPVFEDDDQPTIVLNKSASGDANQNFLKSFAGLG